MDGAWVAWWGVAQEVTKDQPDLVFTKQGRVQGLKTNVLLSSKE